MQMQGAQWKSVREIVLLILDSQSIFDIKFTIASTYQPISASDEMYAW